MITTFNTDVALANLFACRKKANMCISYEGLCNYIKFIQTGNPLLMSTDISHKTVNKSCRKHYKLYKVTRSLNGKTLYIRNPNHYRPNLDYFMADYDNDDRKYIQHLTELWVKEKVE